MRPIYAIFALRLSKAPTLWAAVLSVIVVLLGHPFAAQARNVQKLTTPGGIGLWLVEDHGIPLIALGFAIRGGSVLDPEGKEGAGDLLANMLDEGAGPYSADEFKQKLEAVGSELSFSVSQLAFSGGLLTLTKHLDSSAELLKFALLSPRLNDDDFKQAQQQEIASLAFENRSPQRVAIRQFYAEAFAGHPYARPVKGTERTLADLKIEDIRAQRERLLTKTGLHVVIVGAIDAENASALIDKVFAPLPEKKEKTTPRPITLKPFQKTIPALPGQSLETAVFALPTPQLGDPDFFTAMALNHIAGSGNFDAWLTRELRVARGLTYSVSSQIIADPVTSIALGTLSTEPGKMDEALTVLKDVLAELRAKGPAPNELENAKNSLNGSYLLGLDSSAKLANNLIGLWIDGLSADYADMRKANLNAIQQADAQREAKTLYDPKALSLLIMRPKG
jgi:zinc protease